MTWLALFDTEPELESVGDDAVRVTGGVQWGAASHGVEVFYARRVAHTRAMLVTLELPVAHVPRVRPAAGSEIFDHETGASLGPAPDFKVVYFTPRINFAFPAFGALDFLVALGAGVARFSEVRNGQSYEETGYPVYVSLGAAYNLTAHWAVRAGGGGYGHGVATSRSLRMVNASLIWMF